VSLEGAGSGGVCLEPGDPSSGGGGPSFRLVGDGGATRGEWAPRGREGRRRVDHGGPAEACSASWSRLYSAPIARCDGDGRVRSVLVFTHL